MTTGTGNLGDIFAEHAASDRTAVIDLYDPDRPREKSFKALHASCDAVASGLVYAGLQPGDRIAVLALNRLEYLEVMFGAMRAGCVPVMVNVKLPAETIRFILKDADARIAFADPEFAPICPEGLRCVQFGEAARDSYADFLRPGRFESYYPAPDEVAEQPYTSGSTGRPKGVLLTHAGQLWMVASLVASRDMAAEDTSVISAPLYHKNALLAVKSAIAPGGRVALFARFDAEQYIKAIERYRLTILTGVPTMYALILQRPELLAKVDKRSVRACSMGSAPASGTLLDNLARVFPNAALYLNYGITEGGPVIFSWHHADGLPRPRMTVGYPLEGVDIRLVDGPSPDEGTLLVRNPGVMLGYHNLPKETAKCLRDGWLDTGDVLKRDADGWYYFVGRVDDMFVCAGENIYPGEVEAMLERHPDILQAVVVPAPNELKAHVPFAFVVKKPGAALDEAAVKRHALANGPAYAHPRRVFFLDDLPLSGTNKIDRKGLMRRAADAAAAEGAA
jgi:acyl-CoA synthetase (AMP-forming)/AMP-acid ligase II